MIEHKSIPFETPALFKVACPDCGHEWESSAKSKILSCSLCGKRIKNPSNPYNNKPPTEVGEPITCHICGKVWAPKSKHYRLTCTSCGAWVINSNSTYKPLR